MPAARRCFAGSAGCNLWSGREQDRASAICQFCDTDFVGTDGTLGGRYADGGRARRCHRRRNGPGEHANRYVVLTGGEPLLQVDAALIDALHARGFAIGVETNGTIEPPDGIDWVCVSPKAGAELRGAARPRTEAGLSAGRRDAGRVRGPRLRAIFAAADGRPGRRRQHRSAAIDYCLRHPQWRLSVQTHKTLGHPLTDRGGALQSPACRA